MLHAQVARYVSTTGSDINSGTMSSPYLTPTYAATQCADGDTIIIRGGTYNLSTYIRLAAPNLTIKSYPGEWAILVAPVNDIDIDYCIYIQNPGEENFLIENLEIIGGYYYGIKTESNFDNRIPDYPNHGTSNIIIRNCKIHDTGRDCIKITPASNNIKILNCEIYNSGVGPSNITAQNAEGIDNVNGDNMIVYGCYIHDIFSNGLYAKGGAANCIIENNLIEDCGEGGALLGYWDTDEEWFDTIGIPANLKYIENVNGLVRNNIIRNCNFEGIGIYGTYQSKVYHNTIVNCAITEHAGIFIGQGTIYNSTGEVNPSTRDFIIQNNIISIPSATDRYFIEVREQNGAMLAGTNIMTHNIYYKSGSTGEFSWYGNAYNLADWRTNSGLDITTSSITNPILNTNLHLTSSSPCIGLALNLSGAVIVDYDGMNRVGLDIGADEYNNGTELIIPPNSGTIGTGITNYQATISIDENTNNTVVVYPTLTEDIVNIQLETQNDEVQILDIQGNVVFSKIISKNEVLNLQNFHSGLYILRFLNHRKSVRIVKL